MAEIAQTQTGFADVNGARLRYEVAGDGHPLVLVHAGIADHRMWDDQFHVFAEHYRVVRYDMRGFGQSQPVPGPFSFSGDLYGLLKHLNIDRAHLIGCSMGGATCMNFTLEHPDMVSALVMVCSAPSGMPYESEGELPPIIQALIAADEAGDLERMNELEVRLWVDGLYRTAEQVNPVVRERVRDMNKIALQNAAEQGKLEPSPEGPAVGRLSEITVPTLVVVGEVDVPTTHAAAKLMAAHIPNAQQVVIKNTAHLPNMERPDEFNQIVLDFLRVV